jgi:hypothetical protein
MVETPGACRFCSAAVMTMVSSCAGVSAAIAGKAVPKIPRLTSTARE